MKLMATGDNHWELGARFEECKRVHWWMVDLARAQGVQLFVCTGDMYERASSPEERQAVAEWLIAMASVCPVIVIKGNHDPRRDLAILAKLESTHPIIVEEGAAVHVVAGVAVACVAWPERAQLAAAFRGESSVGLDQVAQEQLRAVLRGLGEELAQHDGPRLGAGHFFADGSVVGKGQPVRGHEMKISLSDLALLRAPLTVMGHIHQAQHWTHEGCDIVYTGSPYKVTYGENEEKSVVIAEYSGCDLVGWKRVATPCAPMFLATHAFGDHGFAGRDWQGLPSDLNELHRAFVRLSYSVPTDRQEEARAQVALVKQALLDAGAADVQPDPKVNPTGTARAPKVATESSLEGKLLALWEARGSMPAIERAAELLSKANTLSVGEKDPTGGNVRLEALRARGVGPFRDEISVDFSAIDAQLIAVCGDNGAGKSTLLELFPGAMYRDTPTRGSLVDLATTRDAFVEARLQNGQSWTIKQTLDNVSRTGTALVLDGAGKPAFDTTKVSDFDAWSEKHIQDPSLFYAGSFAAQRKRGFLDMTVSERKELLVQLLGLERYEHQAADALARAKARRDQLVEKRAQLSALATTDLEALEAAVGNQVAAQEHAADGARAARTALERAKAAAGDAARAAELAEQRRGAEARLKAAQDVLAGIDVRLANNRAVLAAGDEIRAAVARAAELGAQLATARTTASAAQLEAERAQGERRSSSALVVQANEVLAKANSAVARIEMRLLDRDKVREAAGQLADLASVVLVTQEQIKGLEARAAELEQVLVGGKDRRIGVLRSSLEAIWEGCDLPGMAAATGLEADNLLADRAAEAPAELQATRDTLAACRVRLENERAVLAVAQRLAARAPEIAATEVELSAARVELETAESAAKTADGAAAAASTAATAAASHARAEAEALASLDQQLAALQPLLAQQKRLEDASARVDELTAGKGPAGDAVAAAECELAALPVVDVATIDLGAYERAVTAAEAAEARARDAQTRATAALEQGRVVVEKRAALSAEMVRIDGELSDWTRLAQDLGRDGLQAMEIDAALPEIYTLANHLLHSCLGSRFTVELRTSRVSSNGKKVLEGLDFRVLDTERGREADAETYSGGECVLVGEAASLALTMLACRRAGAEKPVLIRDETGAALQPEKGRAYVAMLRKAALELDAAHVIYVSHTPELQELADARILIADGQITID